LPPKTRPAANGAQPRQGEVMNLIEYIQQIDKRIEQRKEVEQQNSLFGMDGDLEAEGALAMTTSYHQYIPNPGGVGGGTHVKNGKIVSTSMPIPGGGRVVTRY